MINMQGLCQRFLRSMNLHSPSLSPSSITGKFCSAFRSHHTLVKDSRSSVFQSPSPAAHDINLHLNASKLTRALNLSRSVTSLRNVRSHSILLGQSVGALVLPSLNSLDFNTSLNSRDVNEVAKRGKTSLARMHRKGVHHKKRPPRKPLDGNPFMKGVVLRTLIKKPKKPNSANRKCVLVKLSNGKEKVAYVPGIGHNLQEHNVVLVRVGRLRDVPGVKIKCVRGVYDLPHVQKVQQ